MARIVSRWRRMKYLSEPDQRRLTCALRNMRMSCNSACLLDRETDQGAQGGRTGGAARRTPGAGRGEGGGVQPVDPHPRHCDSPPGGARARLRQLPRRGAVGQAPALVECFRDDPDCRVLLSTDAGAAGMLSVLAFKPSLAAGILDGCASEVPLGAGDRERRGGSCRCSRGVRAGGCPDRVARGEPGFVDGAAPGRRAASECRCHRRKRREDRPLRSRPSCRRCAESRPGQTPNR